MLHTVIMEMQSKGEVSNIILIIYSTRGNSSLTLANNFPMCVGCVSLGTDRARADFWKVPENEEE